MNRHSIEILEARIAPAVIVNPRMVTFTDTDGDAVTITVSHGDLTNHVIFEGGFGDVASGSQQLLSINLNSAQFTDANVTVSVTPGMTGDGMVHFGVLNATGVDLGDVNIQGDVGKILAGDANVKTKAMTSLMLHTLGNATNVGAPDFNSVVKGPMGNITFTGDMFESTLTTSGSIGDVTIGGDINKGALSVTGSIGTIAITGNLIGGADPSTGVISSTASIEAVSVTSIEGGSGTNSGRISCGGNLDTVTIGNVTNMVETGSLLGGSGDGSGAIVIKGNLNNLTDNGGITGGSGKTSGAIVIGGSVSGTLGITGSVMGGAQTMSGVVQVTGGLEFFNASSLMGGAGLQSGSLSVKGHVGNVSVGSVTGGSGDFSGAIIGGSVMASINVNGSVTGDVGAESGSITTPGQIKAIFIKGSFFGGAGDHAGLLSSGAGIAAVTINGSVTGASGAGQGSGWITTNGNLGSVTIHGAVNGADGRPIIISALGTNVVTPGSTVNPTIGNLEVDGDATFLSVLAGYDTTLKAKNADAQIEKALFKMDVSGLNLIAGAVPGPAGFGTTGDKAIAGGSPALLSKIVNLEIDGSVNNTSNPTDHFGIVAQEIDAVTLVDPMTMDTVALTLTMGPHNDQGTGIMLGTSTDATVREI